MIGCTERENAIPGLVKRARLAVRHLIEAEKGLREVLGPSVREEALEAKEPIFWIDRLSVELWEIEELSSTIALQVKKLLDDFQRE